jgi:hypothetical protein
MRKHAVMDTKQPTDKPAIETGSVLSPHATYVAQREELHERLKAVKREHIAAVARGDVATADSLMREGQDITSRLKLLGDFISEAFRQEQAAGVRAARAADNRTVHEVRESFEDAIEAAEHLDRLLPEVAEVVERVLRHLEGGTALNRVVPARAQQSLSAFEPTRRFRIMLERQLVAWNIAPTLSVQPRVTANERDHKLAEIVSTITRTNLEIATRALGAGDPTDAA